LLTLQQTAGLEHIAAARRGGSRAKSCRFRERAFGFREVAKMGVGHPNQREDWNRYFRWSRGWRWGEDQQHILKQASPEGGFRLKDSELPGPLRVGCAEALILLLRRVLAQLQIAVHKGFAGLFERGFRRLIGTTAGECADRTQQYCKG
jgi:hypothetical protein